VFGARPPETAVDAFILSESEDMLDGLCESLAKFVETVLQRWWCWKDRQTNPSMFVQHGRQWRLECHLESQWRAEVRCC
jgi:hypothetical protein